MLGLLLLASSAALVPGVPDMVTAEICVRSMGAGPTFSREAFDKQVAGYVLSPREVSNELIFCEEYVYTSQQVQHSQRRRIPASNPR